jgi:MEMO1 family protein
MILPRLRSNLDFMPSPIPERPGLLIRDCFGYSDAILVIPPFLSNLLIFFDGVRTKMDLEAELVRLAGNSEIGNAAQLLADRLSEAGFLEDETYSELKERCHSSFAQSAVRKAAHAGKSYPAEIDPLREVMDKYLGGGGASSTHDGMIGIAAPHASPEHAWQSYQAAYQCLTPDLRDHTFVVLGTSHYGAPDKFGLTRKPFETPLGRTRIDEALVSELEGQPAILMEDYCHAVEHSIEFQVVFLQSIYGPDVRILPILCGSFGRSIDEDGLPEENDHVKRFLGALGEIGARESKRLFWVLGIDMAHMGVRYGDKFTARANLEEMALVAERDKIRIERINASDVQGFWDLVKENKEDLKWCGSSPVYTFLKSVPGAQGSLHRYQQWNIDAQSVVTFAGLSFCK